MSAHGSTRKTFEHRATGTLTLDCDVLAVPGADLHVVVYTAPAGSVDADRLAFLAVRALGTLAR